jgi:hypothetical protein
MSGDVGRIIAEHHASQAIALGIVMEAVLSISRIFEGLAQREMEVETIVLAQTLKVERPTHGGNVFICELEDLEIGEAPPHFAEARRKLECMAVGGDCLVGLADGLEHVAVAHPDRRALGLLVEDFAVKPRRFLITADSSKGRGAQAQCRRVLRIVDQQVVQHFERFRRPMLAVQNGRKIGPSRIESGGEFERPTQQILGIGEASDTGSNFGQHSNRRHVERIVLQAGSQKRLGDGNIILDKRLAGADQERVVSGDDDCVQLRLLGRFIGAGRSERPSKQTIGIGTRRHHPQDLAGLRGSGVGIRPKQSRAVSQGGGHRSGRSGIGSHRSGLLTANAAASNHCQAGRSSTCVADRQRHSMRTWP